MSDPLLLSDSVVLVTGGLGGNIGRAVAKAARAHGARLALVDHAQPPEGAEGELLLGGVDLTDPEDAKAALDKVGETFGRLDALVNVVGSFRMETVAEGSLKTWELLFALNVKTAVATTQAALPLLIQGGGGSIVNVGAASAAIPAGPGLGPYTATKAAMGKLTEALAAELKDQGVRANSVLPTIVDTPPNRAAMPDADFSRWVTPEALADVIVFLCSPMSRVITGAQIPVPGRV